MTNSNSHDFAERVRHNQRQLTSDPEGRHIIVTTDNTMAPCVIIGERAAEILREEHKLYA
jgi:hypothetical protein